MQEPLVLVHHAGTTTSLVRGGEHSFSTFGGPLEPEVAGVSLPQPLHQIALLNHNQLGVLGAPSYVFDLPLLYGMRYSGCTLRYTFERAKVVIENLHTSEAYPDWPYKGFPELLPYHPLEVSHQEDEDWQAFSERASNLPCEQPSELVVLVPPPACLGFTLWGRGGDAEGVTIVFECDLKAKRVVSYNVCS